jgi:hypothetical protein
MRVDFPTLGLPTMFTKPARCAKILKTVNVVAKMRKLGIFAVKIAG